MTAVLLISSSVALMGAAVLLVLFLTSEKEAPLVNAGDLARRREDLAASSPLWRGVVHLSALLTPLHSRPMFRGYLRRIDVQLSLAGFPWALRAEEFLAAKELLALVLCLSALGLGFRSPLAAALSLSLGFFYPDLRIREVRRERVRGVLRALPLTLDLLTLCVEAGLDFIGAMGRLVEKIPAGPLREELYQTVQEIRMGRGRADALREMSARMGIPEVSLLTSTIVQAGEMGIGMGKALRVYSTELRAKRFREAEKRAMEAPVKMSFPLLLIFASVFVLLFGALAVDMMRGRLF